MRRRVATVLPALVAVLLLAPAAAAVEPAWRLEQPPPPPGAPFSVPLGTPGDLKFIAPSRGLLAVEGNATVAPGLYAYDGTGWHQLATVCGGSAQSLRIAIAGPREFWTITEPSKPRAGIGTALCRFKDGNVVGSFSTALESPDPYRRMAAAACNGPDDCWFGGFAAEDPTGERRGAFHLHWDGVTLTTFYAPQGRGVTDIEPYRSGFYETVLVGRSPGDRSAEVDRYLFEDEGTRPRLIHRIEQGIFSNDPFLPPDLPGLPTNGSELLALASDGADQLWAVGGGASSGPAAPEIGIAPRPPLAARLVNGTWNAVPVQDPGLTTVDRFVDVAPVPGTDTAWVAVDRFTDRIGRVARISSSGVVDQAAVVPAGGPGRGDVAKIAFTAPNDGWLVTSDGWVFHYTDGTALPEDPDPAFRGPITFRPNEAAEQFIPDTPPADDSELFKPPPIELQQGPPAPPVKRLKALLRNIKTKLRGKTLVVRFVLSRKARVGLIARRKRKVVARTRSRMMRPGKHVLRLRLERRRWPTSLRLSAREPGVPTGGGGGDSGDTVTTGGDAIATGTRGR